MKDTRALLSPRSQEAADSVVWARAKLRQLSVDLHLTLQNVPEANLHRHYGYIIKAVHFIYTWHGKASYMYCTFKTVH